MHSTSFSTLKMDSFCSSLMVFFKPVSKLKWLSEFASLQHICLVLELALLRRELVEMIDWLIHASMIAQRQRLTSDSSFLTRVMMNFIVDLQSSIHCTKHKTPPNTWWVTHQVSISIRSLNSEVLHNGPWCHIIKNKSQKGVWKCKPLPALACRDPQQELSCLSVAFR